LQGFGGALRGAAEPIVRLVLEAVTPLPQVLGVLRDVQRSFPAVRFELRTERLTGPLEALRDGHADLVIAGTHGMDRRTMAAQPFCSVRIVPVARHDHALARAGAPVSAELLRQYPQVVLTDSARGDLTQTLNVLEGGLRWTVTDVASKLEIIQAGMGWGGLPEHVVAPALRVGTLVELEVREFDVRAIELSTMRRIDRPAGVVAGALWARLSSRAEDATAPSRSSKRSARKRST
jgi:DNA-binding transcriptional LysR family regulator